MNGLKWDSNPQHFDFFLQNELESIEIREIRDCECISPIQMTAKNP